MTHKPWFGHPYPNVKGPICRECGQKVTAEMVVDQDQCPGRPKCEPPAVHIFLHGSPVCECRAIDYSMLAPTNPLLESTAVMFGVLGGL